MKDNENNLDPDVNDVAELLFEFAEQIAEELYRSSKYRDVSFQACQDAAYGCIFPVAEVMVAKSRAAKDTEAKQEAEANAAEAEAIVKGLQSQVKELEEAEIRAMALQKKTEELEKAQADANKARAEANKFKEVDDPYSYMKRCAQNALNRSLKEDNRQKRHGMEKSNQAEENDFGPCSIKATLSFEIQERRARQGLKLSDTFRTFVNECESKGTTSLRIKERIERHLLGEDKEVTLCGMHRQYFYDKDGNKRTRKQAENLRDRDLSVGWKRLAEIRGFHDVRGTAFDTTPRRKVEKSIVNKPDPAKGNPNPTEKAIEDMARVIEKVVESKSSAFVHHLIVRDTTAFCPSSERVSHLDDSWEYNDCPDELLDVFYHVKTRKCQFCNGEAGQIAKCDS